MGVRFPQGGCKYPKKPLIGLFVYPASNLPLILFENQIQTTSTSPCRTQVQPAASFLVCFLIFIEYQLVEQSTRKAYVTGSIPAILE